MDLSVQASPVVSWRHHHHQLWAGRTRFSSSQLGVLSRHSRHHGIIRCSTAESGGETVDEKRAPETTTPKAANDVDSGSWLEFQGNSDPFFGWTSDGSQHPNGNSAAGWMKIGGLIVLTLGFALGARSLYLKRDLAREVTVAPPATEEKTTGSFSKATDVVETPQEVDLKENSEASVSNAEGSVEETKQQKSKNEGAQPASVQNLGSEDEQVEESSINDNPSTVSTSDKSGDAGDLLETSAADDEKPAEPVVMHTSAASEEDISPDVNKGADFSDEDSTPSYTSADGDNMKDILDESDMPDKLISEEPMLDESLSQDDYIFDYPQEKAPAFGDTENLAREEGEYAKAVSRQDGWGGEKPNVDLFVPVEGRNGFLPATITAPSTPPKSLANSLGEVIVPAHVDQMQEQILAALQALKVMEADVRAGDICTRREYARWLMAASAVLTRSPAHKVLPAMYIENVSVLAYDDVTPQDQDFPFVQGLAEAGLLSSRLVEEDHQAGMKEYNAPLFSPDSPLARQDLVTWKVALERKPADTEGIPTSTGLMALRDKFGFMDLDKIHEDAWPALLVDMNAGEQSIVALAFGHTRRLQPQKPVTKGQAAVALATGEAWELVSEELARLEAESVAEAAVVAELALEAKAQKEVAAAFEKLVQVEREKQQASTSMLESTRAELEQIKAVHDTEKLGLLKDRAALDAEKELLSSAKLEVEQQALALSSAKLEATFQREQADKLRAEAEEERALISKVRSELEIEKNALILARSWAEDEARKAQEHSRVLEQAKRRWDSQGIQVNVDKELDTIDEKVKGFSPSWHYDDGAEAQETPVKNGLVTEDREAAQAHFSRIDWLQNKSREMGRTLVDAFLRFLYYLQLVFHAIQQHATGFFGRATVRLHEARVNCVDRTSKTVEGIKRTVPSAVAGLSSSLREGSLKAIDEWKGGAEKLSEKFKAS
ncbi:hypothetical protein GOP47_0025274 [Adiantum capillus-veneris]|uniref:SLH domain-containing protein n=1 Tax=Adiantum capillus-veneris TaxID=13818 RepID=A0A9D4U0E5_ADICA|nr:hypothetical protein GOP47_0025274 [Adiantum capillus-veneris]